MSLICCTVFPWAALPAGCSSGGQSPQQRAAPAPIAVLGQPAPALPRPEAVEAPTPSLGGLGRALLCPCSLQGLGLDDF